MLLEMRHRLVVGLHRLEFVELDRRRNHLRHDAQPAEIFSGPHSLRHQENDNEMERFGSAFQRDALAAETKYDPARIDARAGWAVEYFSRSQAVGHVGIR